jgi:DNA (cytosine-5)-methyltransferase 1
MASALRVAEFFAGIGLVRLALEPHGFQVVWANDIAPAKQRLYARNFDATHFHLRDVRDMHGADLPDSDLATASFPCTDLSLAGRRRGLAGAQSGLFWQFARVLDELGPRRPAAVLLENVPSLASSHGGADLARVIERLNEVGYSCDLLVIDARHFTPQSRARLFIIGSRAPLAQPSDWTPSALRPPWIEHFVRQHPALRLHVRALTLPAPRERTLADIVERLGNADPRWWDPARASRFMAQLAPLQLARLERLRANATPHWATAYRRTRHGRPAWEIRADTLSGCLRTARGGSSKQALVEAGAGAVRLRWMTAREYARLQGADTYCVAGVPENQALFGFGDAVCVPVVSWLAEQYLRPLLMGELATAFAPA